MIRSIDDFWAYVIPMAIFLAGVQVGSTWPNLYMPSYVLRAVLTAAALIVLWPHYTKIRWDYWWLGMIVGIVGVVQWIGMQHFLQNHFTFFKPSPDAFDPMEHFKSNPNLMWSFIVVRIASATLVVPVMEELFWRDWLWRTTLAPNNFKLAEVGEWGWQPFLIVTIAFCSVHGIWFPTAFVWGAMIAILLVRTKSLGACIIAHAVTNLLLGLYVLHSHEWNFW